MKYLVFPLLLAALLTGCSGNPSKEVAIEDREHKAVETAPAEVVEAKPLGNEAAQVATTGKPIDAVVAQGSQVPPVTSKPVESKPEAPVETHGVTAPNTDVNRIAEAKPAADSGNAVGAPLVVAENKLVPAQDGSVLPYSGGTNLADLKDPASPLSKRRIQFDFDSSAIRDEYRPILEAHAQYLKGNKSAKAILQGNTDERGSREYNLALGQRRAESVFKALNLLGVPEGQMEAVSLGEEKPIAEGHDEAAWSQNRRTEILYQGE